MCCVSGHLLVILSRMSTTLCHFLQNEHFNHIQIPNISVSVHLHGENISLAFQTLTNCSVEHVTLLREVEKEEDEERLSQRLGSGVI